MKVLRSIKWFVGITIGIFFLASCTEYNYDSKAIAVAGSYDGYVQNGYYTFNVDVTMDGNDDVLIEAMFDDYDWDFIRADLDDRGDGSIDFDIPRQDVYGGARLWGDGIWVDGYLQLDYSINWGYETIRYRLIADQYY